MGVCCFVFGFLVIFVMPPLLSTVTGRYFVFVGWTNGTLLGIKHSYVSWSKLPAASQQVVCLSQNGCSFQPLEVSRSVLFHPAISSTCTILLSDKFFSFWCSVSWRWKMMACFLKQEAWFGFLGRYRCFTHWKVPVTDRVLVSLGQVWCCLNFPWCWKWWLAHHMGSKRN